MITGSFNLSESDYIEIVNHAPRVICITAVFLLVVGIYVPGEMLFKTAGIIALSTIGIGIIKDFVLWRLKKTDIVNELGITILLPVAACCVFFFEGAKY